MKINIFYKNIIRRGTNYLFWIDSILIIVAVIKIIFLNSSVTSLRKSTIRIVENNVLIIDRLVRDSVSGVDFSKINKYLKENDKLLLELSGEGTPHCEFGAVNFQNGVYSNNLKVSVTHHEGSISNLYNRRELVEDLQKSNGESCKKTALYKSGFLDTLMYQERKNSYLQYILVFLAVLSLSIRRIKYLFDEKYPYKRKNESSLTKELRS